MVTLLQILNILIGFFGAMFLSRLVVGYCRERGYGRSIEDLLSIGCMILYGAILFTTWLVFIKNS
jgi:hypothetical protein